MTDALSRKTGSYMVRPLVRRWEQIASLVDLGFEILTDRPGRLESIAASVGVEH